MFDRIEDVLWLDVQAIGVVQKTVIGLGDNGQRPEAIADGIRTGAAMMIRLPPDVGVAHGAHAVRVGDEDGAIDEPGFFHPGSAGHFAVAVLREPAAEGGSVGIPAARPNHRHAGADRIAFNQSGVADLDAGDVGDGVQRARGAVERNAKIASALGQRRSAQQEQ